MSQTKFLYYGKSKQSIKGMTHSLVNLVHLVRIVDHYPIVVHHSLSCLNYKPVY